MRRQFDNVDIQASIQQAPRCFKPKQPAAENYGFARFHSVVDDPQRIVERPEQEHAVLEAAGIILDAINRRDKGPGPCSEYKMVIWLIDTDSTNNLLRAIHLVHTD